MKFSDRDIEDLKIALSSIVFDMPASYAETLTEHSVFKNKTFTPTQLAFMKQTTVSDIQHVPEQTNATLRAFNNAKHSELSMFFSNRGGHSGELRGTKLDDLFNTMKQTNPSLSVYDALQKAIRTATYSSDFFVFLNAFAKEKGLEHDEAWKACFTLFANHLLLQLNQRVQEQKITDPKDSRLWEGIHIQTEYEKYILPYTLLKTSEKLRDHFDKSSAEYPALNEITQTIDSQINALNKDKPNFYRFKETILAKINQAQKDNPTLNTPRTFGGKRLKEMVRALHILTLGLVPEYRTQSIQKMDRIKARLQEMAPKTIRLKNVIEIPLEDVPKALSPDDTKELACKDSYPSEALRNPRVLSSQNLYMNIAHTLLKTRFGLPFKIVEHLHQIEITHNPNIQSKYYFPPILKNLTATSAEFSFSFVLAEASLEKTPLIQCLVSFEVTEEKVSITGFDIQQLATHNKAADELYKALAMIDDLPAYIVAGFSSESPKATPSSHG